MIRIHKTKPVLSQRTALSINKCSNKPLNNPNKQPKKRGKFYLIENNTERSRPETAVPAAGVADPQWQCGQAMHDGQTTTTHRKTKTEKTKKRKKTQGRRRTRATFNRNANIKYRHLFV